MFTLSIYQPCALYYGQGKRFQLVSYPLVDVISSLFLISCFTQLNWRSLIYYDFRFIPYQTFWLEIPHTSCFDNILLMLLFVQCIIIMIIYPEQSWSSFIGKLNLCFVINSIMWQCLYIFMMVTQLLYVIIIGDMKPHWPVMSSSKKLKIGNFISSAKFDFHGSILAVYLKYNQVI